MKPSRILLVLIFMTSTLFAQFIMIEDVNGDIHYQKVEKTNKITFGTPPVFSTCGDIVLYEGKYYGTVQIGTQCWFDENLNVGTMINSTNGGTNSDGEQTNNSTFEKYCYDNEDANCATYGGLYQWNEAMQYVTDEGIQGICPDGWHIPTGEEFVTLENAVSGSSNALKAIGEGNNQGAGTNTSGFSALFAGGRDGSNGSFGNLGYGAYFWSSTESSSNSAGRMYLSSNDSDVSFHNFTKHYGFSVRCLKD